jgi:hypothetical protein
MPQPKKAPSMDEAIDQADKAERMDDPATYYSHVDAPHIPLQIRPGLIVWAWNPNPYPHLGGDKLLPYAAIVTQVGQVLPNSKPPLPGELDALVVGPGTTEFKRLAYSEIPAPDCWSWPPDLKPYAAPIAPTEQIALPQYEQ